VIIIVVVLPYVESGQDEKERKKEVPAETSIAGWPVMVVVNVQGEHDRCAGFVDEDVVRHPGDQLRGSGPWRCVSLAEVVIAGQLMSFMSGSSDE
jgi:hypothetical protein